MVKACGNCVPGEACSFHRVVRKLKLQRNSVRRIEQIFVTTEEPGDWYRDPEYPEVSEEEWEWLETPQTDDEDDEEVSMDDLYVFY